MSAVAMIAVACALVLAASHSEVVEAAQEAEAVVDTTGMAQMEWNYDRWSVPWVQLRGHSTVLAPGSNATLMVLACEASALERDRIVRHLSAEECEHRMAAIRAEQDTAIIFRLDLRIFEFTGTHDLARLRPTVTLRLEDDRHRRWSALDVQRGPAVVVAARQGLRHLMYHPPWVRDVPGLHPAQYGVIATGESLTMVEHRARFPRREPESGEPILSRHLRWLRLSLSYEDYEWVATFPFQPEVIKALGPH